MIFSLDVIPAGKGDCLILHYGPKGEHMLLIDGGPSGVYGSHLRPRLEQIRKARDPDEKLPLLVDLLMVSHVDADHIRGILDLTKELKEAKEAHKPQLINVLLGVWHNSFENIIKDTPAKATAAFTDKFGTASMDGDPPEDLTLDADMENLETVRSTLKVLQSVKQGAQLRKDLDALKYSLNPFFDDDDGEKLVLAEGKNSVPMDNGLTLTVLGPMLPELEKLRKEHQKWLKDLAKEGLTPDDVLAAYVDDSVTNLSSIVVLAEVDGESMLLTGDALGKKVLEGLELVGRMEKGGKLHVNILKVPHHGSSNNVELDFFERITADHYVFSGNGEHGNPDRESLEMLLTARGDADYEVHLTYPIDEIDPAREAEWKKQQAREKARQLEKPEKEVRPDWSPEEHSLASFLEQNKSFEKKIRIVPDREPYVINLLEEVVTVEVD
jgi:hypothetical protein